jgi:kynurenine 3-monooxygenase
MTTQSNPPAVAVLGAGLGGTLIAIYLARRGMDVSVFERRPDMRLGVVDHGRSINMTIAERGLRALEPVGLRDAVMKITMPLKGRLVHGEDGRARFQRYGRTSTQVHHSIKRSELNGLLMDAVEALPNARIAFHKRYVRGAKDDGMFVVQDERTGEMEYVQADVIVGADGAYSGVRRDMQRGEPADYQQEFLTEGYKELTIPAGRHGEYQLDPQALHVWPRGESMLIAIPNLDGSFTCTYTMPLKGPTSFASLSSLEKTQAFFERHFGEVLAIAPDVPEEFGSRPPARYLTTTTAPWYFEDRVVLLGDSCHSVLPFYGQGMNAAFEDCRVLDECVGRNPGRWGDAFAEYQASRKRHTDALARLSKDNYVELKEKVRSPMFMARRRVDLALDRLWPSVFSTLYFLVTHTTIPYADAVARCERRRRWLKWTGLEAILTLAALPLAVGSVAEAWLASWRSRMAAPAPAAEKVVAEVQQSYE